MKKIKLILSSSLFVLISPSTFADVQFNRAGFSIGTVFDDHVEFFDRDNDQFLDAITYGLSDINIFDGRENGYITDAYIGIGSNGSVYASKYISVADMNNDGYQDLIAYPFQILINDQKGHFPNRTLPHPFRHNGNHIKMQIADLDDNGTIDLFLSGSSGPNGSFQGDTVVFMNVSYDPTAASQGYFSYERKVLYSPNEPPLFGNISSMKPNGVAIGDVNNDGMPDVIFINSAKGSAKTSTSSVTLNNGSGTLVYGQALSDAEDIALGDLDGDGDLDAYLARSGDLPDEVWFNNGHGVFTNSGQLLGTDDSINTAMADLDGDGDLDVVTTNHNTTQNRPHRVWLNDGTGQLTLSDFSFGTGNKTESLKLVDLDQDGDIDIVTLGGRNYLQHSHYLSSNEVWLNQLISKESAGDFAAGKQYCIDFPSDCGLYVLADVDAAYGQGHLDGKESCALDPHSCNLIDQAELDNAALAAYQSGVADGIALCQNDPSSCNLFSSQDLLKAKDQLATDIGAALNKGQIKKFCDALAGSYSLSICN